MNRNLNNSIYSYEYKYSIFIANLSIQNYNILQQRLCNPIYVIFAYVNNLNSYIYMSKYTIKGPLN